MSTHIVGLDHIAIATKDLDEALLFWQAKLGLRVEHIEELPERGIRVAFLPVGAAGGVRIELVAPLAGREHDSEVQEGPGHSGMSALIDLVARKPA